MESDNEHLTILLESMCPFNKRSIHLIDISKLDDEMKTYYFTLLDISRNFDIDDIGQLASIYNNIESMAINEWKGKYKSYDITI